MSGHSPGPWRLSRTERYVMDSYGSPWVAEITERPEKTANARLIAAAPDLLEALKAAIACGMVPNSSVSDGGAFRHVQQVHVADQIRAAIAKATGGQS